MMASFLTDATHTQKVLCYLHFHLNLYSGRIKGFIMGQSAITQTLESLGILPDEIACVFG